MLIGALAPKPAKNLKTIRDDIFGAAADAAENIVNIRKVYTLTDRRP